MTTTTGAPLHLKICSIPYTPPPFFFFCEYVTVVLHRHDFPVVPVCTAFIDWDRVSIHNNLTTAAWAALFVLLADKILMQL